MTSRGGQANEAGSFHRCGAAAYLAVQGIAGKALVVAGDGPGGPYPVWIGLEGGDAVDDIRVDLSDGTHLYLQSKRSCGDDRHLAATVAQWLDQTLDTGDRVGLVVRDPKGPVRAMAAALRRHRAKDRTAPLAGERRALDALRKRAPGDVDDATLSQRLEAAVVLVLTVDDSSDADFRQAALELENAGVPSGQGVAGVEALQRAMHEQAKRAAGSGLDEWLDVLERARVPLQPRSDGVAGARRRAQLDAIERHRVRLAAQKDQLSFALLAEGIPPLRVDDLLSAFRVEIQGEDRPVTDALADVARRWGRMVITGLPGAGKSTAIRQLAAHWARHPDAPLPVLLPLQRLVRPGLTESDINLPRILEHATEDADVVDKPLLQQALGVALGSGDAALLLDGLDECRDAAQTVANGLLRILAELHPSTGLIMSTRNSAAVSASTLRLPEADLTEPTSLESSLGKLLRHVAEYRVPATGREAWLSARNDWVAASRRDHPALWSVPLLGSLLTLLVAATEAAQLPKSRARLLATAVERSIDRWEELRPGGPPDGWNVAITPPALLAGFRILGHLIASDAAVTRDFAVTAVTEMLGSEWGLAPAVARATARDVLWFWDEHMGVFVDVGERLEARSRQFAEIGDAMWCAEQNDEAQRIWLSEAIRRDTRDEAAVLTLMLVPALISTLLDLGREGPPALQSRALCWAVGAVADSPLEAPERLIVMDALDAATNDGLSESDEPEVEGALGSLKASLERRRRDRDGATWMFVRMLASLALPPEARDHRLTLLTRLPLTSEQRVVSRALALLTDAVSDDVATLPESALDALEQFLDLDVPETDFEPQRISRRHLVFPDTRPLLSGHVEVATLAAPHVNELRPDAAALLHRIGRHGSASVSPDIDWVLAKQGHPQPESWRSLASMMAAVGTRDDAYGWLLRGAAGLADGPIQPPHRDARWRLPAFIALVDALKFCKISIGECRDARGDDAATIRCLLSSACELYGLDLNQVAAQANVVATALVSGDEGPLDVVFAPPPPEAGRHGQAAARAPLDAHSLIDVVRTARSGWIAHQAFVLLWEADHPEVLRLAREALHDEVVSPVVPERRRLLALLSSVLAPNPGVAAVELLHEADPAVRWAAASVLTLLAGDHESDAELARSRLLEDADMTVRLIAGADDANARNASYWSCRDCANRNAVSDLDCAHCSTGARPGSHDRS